LIDKQLAAGEKKAQKEEAFATQFQGQSADLMKVLQSPAGAKLHLDKVQEQPKPEDYQKGTGAFLAAMGVIGAIGSRFTRNAGNASLNSFAGALNGWHEGNLEMYENARKSWEDGTKRTLANNQVELDKYRAVIENQKLNIQQKMAALNILSTQFQNSIMADATRSENYALAFNLYDKLARSNQELGRTFGVLQGFHEGGQEELKKGIEYLNANPAVAASIREKNPMEWAKAQAASQTLNLGLKDPSANQQTLSQQRRPATGLAGYLWDVRQEAMQRTGQPPSPHDELAAIADYSRTQSYQRAAGTQSERVTNATNELKAMIPQALQASNQFDRGRWTKINDIYNDWKRSGSDAGLTDLELAAFGAVSAYVRAINPMGVPRVQERQELEQLKILSASVSKEAFDTQLRRMWTEAQASERAVQETIGGPGMGTEPFPGAAPGGGGQTGGGNVIHYDAQGKRLR
jgi:hypothetical protein